MSLRAGTFNRLHGGKKYYLSKLRGYQVPEHMKNFSPIVFFVMDLHIRKQMLNMKDQKISEYTITICVVTVCVTENKAVQQQMYIESDKCVIF